MSPSSCWSATGSAGLHAACRTFDDKGGRRAAEPMEYKISLLGLKRWRHCSSAEYQTYLAQHVNTPTVLVWMLNVEH